MAQNRFRRVFYQPETTFYDWTDFDYFPNLDNMKPIMAGYQKLYDAAYDVPIPQHLKNKHDVNALQKEYLEPIDNYRTSAVDAFTNGSTVEGIRQLNDLQRFIRQAKQPGGVYEGLETRYDQFWSEKEAWEEHFPDDAKLAGWAIANRMLGLNAFRDESGQIQNVTRDMNVVRNISDEEINSMINSNLAAIKDTLITEYGLSRTTLDDFTTLAEIRSYLGRDYEDILDVIADRVPQDVKNSLRQRYEAQRYYNPNLPANYDPAQIWEYNEDGTVKIDPKTKRRVPANTELSKILRGAAMGRHTIKADHYRTTYKDPVGIHKAKKKIESELNTRRTLATKPLEGAPDKSNIEVKDGKIIFDPKSQILYGEGSTIAPSPWLDIFGKTSSDQDWLELQAMDDIDLSNMDNINNAIDSGKLEEYLPGMSEIVSHNYEWIREQIDKGNQQSVADFLNDSYNQWIEGMGNMDMQYVATDPSGPDYAREQNNMVTSEFPGYTAYYILSDGKKHRLSNMSMSGLSEELNIDLSDPQTRKDMLIYEGRVTSNQDRFPSGEIFTYMPSGKGAQPIQILAAEESVEESNKNSATYKASEPLYNLKKPVSDNFYVNMYLQEEDGTVVPFQQKYPMGLQTRLVKTRESDLIWNEVENLRSSLKTADKEQQKGIKERINTLRQHYNEIVGTPRDKILEPQLHIYDPSTGRKVGDHEEYERLLQIINQ